MKLLLPLVFCFLCFACGPAEPDSVDMVIFGGPIYTMDAQQPTVEAVAVRNGIITYSGIEAPARAMIGPRTQVIDLKGKTMTPGFIDAHAHFVGLGKSLMELNLSEAKSYDEVVAIVAQAVEQAEPGEWITGRGWHQSKWEVEPEQMVKGFPTHHALSAVSPDNPVYLRHASGHAGLANAKALEIAGVTRESEFDETGEIVKDPATGEPTGIFNEESETLVKNLAIFSPEMKRKALELATRECLSQGITAVHDAGVGEDIIGMYEALRDSGQLDLRLYVMLDSKDRKLLESWYKRGPELGDWLTIRSIKCYADGALGSRGAWLLEPYEDQHDNTGLVDQQPRLIGKIAHEGLQNGFQVCTHAIGDRGNREILDQYETAFKDYPGQAKDSRFRIEHAQHLSKEDIPRFAQMGVIASMQGIHMASDRPWAIDRLGKERIEEGAYVWKKLLESGAIIINGTDAPVEPVNPIACFYASVTRRTLDGVPPGGFEPGQRMSREEALRSYTLYAAFGAFQEDKKGSIVAGKWADFTIFSQDIMTIPDDDLLSTQVAYTIVGGEIKYALE